jgi:predicted RNase H-like nuclease (RuvC/YqgF family)
MLFWLRLALATVILVAVAAAVHEVTSFLADKDHQIQQRDQTIEALNAKVEGMRLDIERLKTSNGSLEQEAKRKIEEAAAARQEATMLRTTDTASLKRQNELEHRLSDRERLEQVDRLTHSRRADAVVRVVNKSAKCEIENFFRTDGQCRNGEWVTLTAKAAARGDAGRSDAAEGAASAPR